MIAGSIKQIKVAEDQATALKCLHTLTKSWQLARMQDITHDCNTACHVMHCV